jgi:pyruvate/2-oxoglutarate dehydrogenase complex dihydrolipoamide dehydrogenase (E3) component
LHRGCIPTKEFLETAAVARTVAGAKDFGIGAGPPSVDFAVSQKRKQLVVDQLYQGLAGLMKHEGSPLSPAPARCFPAARCRWKAPTAAASRRATGTSSPGWLAVSSDNGRRGR